MHRTTNLTAMLLAFSLLGPLPQRIFACTSIMVGKKASTDGSVMTSHTCDSHRTGSQIVVVPAQATQAGIRAAADQTQRRRQRPDAAIRPQPTGKIPQVAETYGYLAPAYAAMNERQLAIGESTFGGREELVSEKGLIDCETLTRLMLERATTAREAIRIGGTLIEKYGWCDEGEALTIADPQEVWLMEIVGPGEDAVGAVWAAQRVPDDHVSVVANAARIGEIDLAEADYFMASSNVVRGCRATRATGIRKAASRSDSTRPTIPTAAPASRRRDANGGSSDLLAPSLQLHPNSNVFPFSVKPEKPVGPEKIMEIFRDTFEGTDFDMVKNLTVTDEEGKTVKSPLANPFMPYDMNKMLKINGGWGWRGERPLARWYCMYVHGDPVAVVVARSGRRHRLVRVRQSGHDDLRADLRRHHGSADGLQDRRTHDRIQPPLGLVGIQPRGDAGRPSLGRNAAGRGGGPRSTAGEVPGRPSRRLQRRQQTC